MKKLFIFVVQSIWFRATLARFFKGFFFALNLRYAAHYPLVMAVMAITSPETDTLQTGKGAPLFCTLKYKNGKNAKYPNNYRAAGPIGFASGKQNSNYLQGRQGKCQLQTQWPKLRQQRGHFSRCLYQLTAAFTNGLKSILFINQQGCANTHWRSLA